MTKSSNIFHVDTRPTKDLVVGNLTRDISVEASILDLIDNSIDAARDSVYSNGKENSEDGLPKSYEGYQIELSLHPANFKIEDNCGGITVESLKSMVLRFGRQSTHKLGIGVFGVGLNRAIFKLGKVSHLKTDTGTQRSELVLNVDEYFKSDSWDLPAEEFPSTGNPGTSIEIIQIPNDIATKFGDSEWLSSIKADIGRRYAIFINKGLLIKVNDTSIAAEEIEIRKDSPFPEEYKFFKTNGVSVHIRFGQHLKHRFSAEPDYDKSNNFPLTEKFGWTIVCNDRAVVIADKTWKTGWEGKFHTEFYGFVGIVYFDSIDPSSLPWDTTKFDVDMNNAVYQTALAEMKRFALKWRSHGGLAKQAKKKGEQLLPTPGAGDVTPSPETIKPLQKDKPTTKTIKKPEPTKKDDYRQLANLLPDDIDEFHCLDKHLTLVHEAKKLNLYVFNYSGMALLRILFETSAVTYLDRHRHLEALKSYTVQERKAAGKQIPDEKKVMPTLDEITDFLDKNQSIWGAVKQNHLKHSLQRMIFNKKFLNSALHNPYQVITVQQIFSIRDEALPILRHLIET